MRKGRSSRRSRVSRPNIAPKSASNVDARVSVPSTPNVVVGVPSVTPEPPVAQADAAKTMIDAPLAPATRETLRDTLIAPAPVVDPDDDVRDEAREEPASEERVRVADAVAAEAKEEEQKTEEAAQLELSLTPPPVVTPAAETKVEAVEAKRDDEKVEDEKSGEPVAVAKKVEAIEEESIPPVGDLAAHEQFFSEGDLARHAVDDDLDDVALDKAQRKSDPDVVQRRARFAKYVTWAVGVSAALCLVAVVRTTFSSSSRSIAAANAASAPAKNEVVMPKASPPPAIVEAPKPVVVEAKPAVADAPKPVEETKPAITGDAKEEKAKAKAALNKSKLADAIEAGERAVALDETDSEAWLLLGAAYQEKGQLANAQKAYKSCLEKGTKDRFQRECRLFAR